MKDNIQLIIIVQLVIISQYTIDYSGNAICGYENSL
jgi:hypothetical protein